jgi:hypothetical protein
MTLKRVQIHPRHLPRSIPCDGGPLRFAERQCGQHLERNIRHFRRITVLEPLELLDDLRQLIGANLSTNEVTEQRLTLGVGRFRVDHLQDVGDRRRLTDGLFEYLLRSPLLEPLADHPLRERPERLSPDGSRTHDLDKVSKHLSVVGDTREDTLEEILVSDRQHR